MTPNERGELETIFEKTAAPLRLEGELTPYSLPKTTSYTPLDKWSDEPETPLPAISSKTKIPVGPVHQGVFDFKGLYSHTVSEYLKRKQEQIERQILEMEVITQLSKNDDI